MTDHVFQTPSNNRFDSCGATIRLTGIVGAHGGDPMKVAYPNGDRVGYVTIAYECQLTTQAAPDMEELLELGWFERQAVAALSRREWIDQVLADAGTRPIP